MSTAIDLRLGLNLENINGSIFQLADQAVVHWVMLQIPLFLSRQCTQMRRYPLVNALVMLSHRVGSVAALTHGEGKLAQDLPGPAAA